MEVPASPPPVYSNNDENSSLLLFSELPSYTFQEYNEQPPRHRAVIYPMTNNTFRTHLDVYGQVDNQVNAKFCLYGTLLVLTVLGLLIILLGTKHVIH